MTSHLKPSSKPTSETPLACVTRADGSRVTVAVVIDPDSKTEIRYLDATGAEVPFDAADDTIAWGICSASTLLVDGCVETDDGPQEAVVGVSAYDGSLVWGPTQKTDYGLINCPTGGTVEPQGPVLSVQKTATSTQPTNGYAVGDVIDYEIVVSNVGDQAATGVTIQDPFLNAGIPVQAGGGALAPGDQATVTYSYTVQQGDGPYTLENTATSNSNEGGSQTQTISSNLERPIYVETFNSADVDNFGPTGFDTPNGRWTVSGTVDGQNSFAGNVRYGGDLTITSPVYDIDGWTQLVAEYDVSEDGLLEPGDFYAMDISIDGGPWVNVFTHPDDGVEIASGVDLFNIAGVSSGSTLQVRFPVGNNNSGGQGGGGLEFVRLFDLIIEG